MTIFVDPDCVADRGYDDADCPECGAVRGEFCREGCPASGPDDCPPGCPDCAAEATR